VRTVLDHIVVVAPSLAAGAAFVKESLGVEPQTGGAHPRMGTHNLLLSLGDSTYLEVIAVDPVAPKPSHPRWFALDALSPNSTPRLAAWVVRTPSIHASSAACTSIVGSVESMTRGALSWLITITPDGGLPMGGAAPALIEWQVEPHPARLLTNAGCTLEELEVHHPEPHKVSAVFASIDLQSPPQVRPLPAGAQPFLVAHIQTPRGLCSL
jgi:Glyoxalase-like domain